MKKNISRLLLTAFILNSIPFFLEKTNANDCFTVSAYYSPLPNQEYYNKPNYEAEKILNGNGVAGAGGKKVFPGMFAAPYKYNYGTKIYIEGLGVGEVTDRGGAIVEAGERGNSCDRIDVWMGYGDIGLKKAMTWGIRTVKGYVVDENTPTTINIDKYPIAKGVEKSLTKNTKFNSIFTIDIGVKSSREKTKKLHEFLTSLGLYEGVIDAEYNKQTVKAVFEFQYENKIVNSPKNNGAGLWGPQTREVALKIQKQIDDKKQEELKKREQIKDNTIIPINNGVNNKQNQEDKILTLLSKNEKKSIYKESSTDSIKEIQTILKEIGVYKGEIDGEYNSVKNNLIDYQLKNGIIKNKNDNVAGYFGPQTNKQAKKDYLALASKKQEEKKEQERIKSELASIEKTVKQRVDDHIESIGNPEMGDIGANVRVLQKTLKMLGYFDVEDTAIFGVITKDSLISYQLDKGIIKDKSEEGAGVFGPKTRETMHNELYLAIEKKLLAERNLLTYKK